MYNSNDPDSPAHEYFELINNYIEKRNILDMYEEDAELVRLYTEDAWDMLNNNHKAFRKLYNSAVDYFYDPIDPDDIY